MAKSALEYYADSLGNAVLYDQNRRPSIFVRHPLQKSSEFDALLPATAHPAFVVNGVTDPDLLIGKYMSAELESNGTQYSLPNKEPKVSMEYDTFLTKMKAFNTGVSGSNVTGLTIADHGLLVLTAHKNGWTSHGNNNYGADIGVGTRYELAKSISVGNKRIFRGWEYECLIAHTTAADKLPCDAPAYWKKGKYVGGTYVSSQAVAGSNYSTYNTLTGTGPIDWNFLDDPCLEADIQGNASEQVYGVRLVNMEIQIIPYNNAADPACDLSAESSAWRAILPSGSNHGYTLVQPGTSGTVHYTYQNNVITLDNTAPASGDLDESSKNTSFKDVAVNTVNIPSVPYILYELGLAPLPGTNVDGKLYITMTAEERVARRGGHYNNTSSAGVAFLNFSNARSFKGAYYGARPRSRSATLLT